MPAIITHDTFGREVYGKMFEFIGGSRDEADAFLLGNQGPDPLFYAVVDPRLRSINKFGSTMHLEKPTELIAGFRSAIDALTMKDRRIGRAYAMGFLCHYRLDSTAHPFVYSYEFSLCDAGVEGLTREDSRDVHALIESELDELVLYTKRNTTITHFNPSKDILHASDHVLDVISELYVHVAKEVYNTVIPADTFKLSVKAFRLVQGFFYSPTGFKHNVMGKMEQLVRRYSFFRAMSHRNHERIESCFDNHEHAIWTNPWTEEEATTSFLDLFNEAKKRALTDLLAFDSIANSKEAARAITNDLNFEGKPTNARILAVENV